MQMNPVFFETQHEFRNWLEKFHKTEVGLIVGFYKVGRSKYSMSGSEAVDQSLCFGWIDGIRKSIDKDSYCIRFTPRKKSSIWSTINIKKVVMLTKVGLLIKEGLKSFSFRLEAKSKIYGHEVTFVKLDIKLENQFKVNKLGWDFFKCQAPSHQKKIIHLIMDTKKENTKKLRLAKIIKESSSKKRLIL